MQVPQQDLQVVEHEPMQVMEQAMVVQEVVDQEVLEQELAEQEVVEQDVVEVQTTPKKVSGMLSARNLHKKNHMIA
jgi:hypothetical protein